jgi:UDP-2-acetamido-3-amino-2,3-dideoxy-glucuronate N-acetyltransferase
MVEKPLALSRDEGRELVRLAADKGLTLMVDHILQNHPAYIKLKELADKGALGRIRHIHSRRRSFGKIRTEEDVLWSFAPHDLSMILGLMGREPESVAASGGAWLTPGLADAVEGSLQFSGGATAQVSVTWLNPVKEQRLIVVGEEKMAVFDDTLPWPEKLKLYAHRVAWPSQRPEAKAAEAEAVALEEQSPLTAQCRDFLAAMAGEKRVVSDGAEGLRVLSILEALSASLKNNGQRVALGGCEAAPPAYFAHPTAIVDEGVTIGAGSKIWHFSHILSGSTLGEKCNLGQNVVVGPKVTVGRSVKIQNNVSVYEGVTLEDDVFCGPSMVFTNVYNPRANIVRKDEYRQTLIRQGASIGANATVVCGHTLGAWCFIGAGAVVTRDVPDYALMVGSPARRTGWVCRCGTKLPESLTCPACGKSYEQHGETLQFRGEK